MFQVMTQIYFATMMAFYSMLVFMEVNALTSSTWCPNIKQNTKQTTILCPKWCRRRPTIQSKYPCCTYSLFHGLWHKLFLHIL